MSWGDTELGLIALAAMLSPTTLSFSVLALVLGDRPLRTGIWFYLGAVSAMLAIGVVAAFVLGNSAASNTSTPKTWVAVVDVVAGALLLVYVARGVRRPPQPNVLYSGVESLHLAIQHTDGDGVRIDGTTGDDKVKFFHGLTEDSGTFDGTMDTNNATGVGPFAMTEMTFSGASPLANDSDVNFFNPGGTDSFEFNGTAESDSIQVGPGEAGGTDFRNTLDGQVVSRIEAFNVSSGLIRGLGGDDTFTRLSTLTTPLTFQGGPGAGDELHFTAATNAATTLDLGLGTVTSTGDGTTTFTGIEDVTDTSSGGTSSLTVNGTSGPDAFDYMPTGATAGIVSLPGGPSVAFSGVGTTFTLDSLGGADRVTVEGTSGVDGINENGSATASTVQVGGFIAVTLPNATTEALTVKGGPGDDTLNVDSSGAAVSIPTTYDGAAGLDGANITGSGASMTITFGGTPRITGGAITQLNLQSVQTIHTDTAAGGLTVLGTAADDQFSYLPLGSAAGQITRNGSLPDLGFSNAASLTIDPLAGNDSVEVQGTAGADTFTAAINPTATVQVGGMLTASIPTATTELLKLGGAAGSDTFNITTFDTTSMNVAVDGNLPSPKKNGDTLKVITTSTPVKVKKISAGKANGEVNVDYATGAAVHITYASIESVKTAKV